MFINMYDNIIVYIDYVFGEIVNILKNVLNVFMLYLFDYGEFLGEKGFYLYGFFY